MMVDIHGCRSKILLGAIPILGPDLEVKVMDLGFSYKSQNFCTEVYIAILSRPFNKFHVYIWHDGRCRSRGLLSMIPTRQTLNFHIKVKMFAF